MKSFLQFLSLLFLAPAMLLAQPVVSTMGKSILVNDSAYIIRGVCYQPVAIGDNRFDPLDFSHIDQDIQLMTDAKINTIRTYVPITNASVLDKFAAAGIMIIIGFPNYDDTFQYPDINHGTYLDYINTYKNHAAILMWELGNEYNYHPEWFSNNINNWYTILNNAAGSIHAADPNHPVSTAHGEVPASVALTMCPNIDVWGMNVYRWDNPAAAITSFAAMSTKPCYFSESGGDRYNINQGAENQQHQANADVTIWNHIKAKFDLCSGITFFSFVDEWWKKGSASAHDATGFSNSVPYDSYANEEWWGIVDIYRNPTLAYYALQNVFTDYWNGIDDLSMDSQAWIFPNPAGSNATIRMAKPLNEEIVLEIHSLTGSILYSERMQINGTDIVIPLQKWQHLPGACFVSVRSKFTNYNDLLLLQ